MTSEFYLPKEIWLYTLKLINILDYWSNGLMV